MIGPWVEWPGGEDPMRARIAADLLLLADLHDHEAQRDAIVALWARCYDGLMQAKPYGAALRDAVNGFCAGLTEIPSCLDAYTDGVLQEDFRRIYAAGDGGRGARQSAWCDGEAKHLRIEATVLGQWARQHGIAVESWPQDDGDQLTTQLRYLAYLVAADGVAAPIASLKHYLEGHLLCWIDHFAAGVAAQGGTRLYRELAGLTAAYVHELEQRFARGVLDWSLPPDKTPIMAEADRTAQRGFALSGSRRSRYGSWHHR